MLVVMAAVLGLIGIHRVDEKTRGCTSTENNIYLAKGALILK